MGSNLEGRVALVTGAGRRVGLAIATALADEGMSLALHHHTSREACDRLAARVREDGAVREVGGVVGIDRLDAGIGEEEPPAAPSTPPASSEEGVIGAYQVGDAHFTIYADGSIQARTPDGDYSFDSMDELKTYLASEKSRLGL